MLKWNVKVTFTEPILGGITKSGEGVYTKYIASKAALTDEELAEELETVEKLEEKGWTGFHIDDGQPVLYDYVVKGFFKGSCGLLRRFKDTLSADLTAYKKVIDGGIFAFPRRIPLVLPEDYSVDVEGVESVVYMKVIDDDVVCERPLRTSGKTGDRVALARSDTCPVGTTMEFTLEAIGELKGPKGTPSWNDYLTEWFNYGARLGFGQWRNASWGRFTYELEEATE